MWTDSHCHLSPQDIAPARDAGVTRVINVGTDLASSAAAIDLARSNDGVFATVGLHPHDASSGLSGFSDLLDRPDPVVVGIGECGLDFYYEYSPRAEQIAVFGSQVELARSLDLTLVIHTRDAWEETFALLTESPPPSRWVMHCFTGGPAEARRALDMGAYLSFSGIVSFKNAGEIREAAALCPADRILVETDSPYLAPVPNRGKPNQPAWVPLVGEAVAAARGAAVEEIERLTWDNAARAFRLP
jgi:TatD DNase family protein